MIGRAVDNAKASGDIVLRYLTLSDSIFSSWFWGDDRAFDERLQEFEGIVHPAIQRAMTLLVAACHARAATAVQGTEQLKVRVYAYLIGAAKERNRGRRRHLLDEAVIAADKCGQPFYGAIARVAIGIVDPPSAERAFTEARALAGETWSAVFQEAVDAVGRGQLTGHMLEAFAARYCDQGAAPSTPKSRLRVAIVAGTVQIDGRPITLSAREFELLTFLALRDAPASSDLVSDSLWPDSDPERARSTLKVTLSRLRNRLGDPTMIVSTQHGYTLNAECEIDVDEFVKSRGTASGVALPSEMQLEVARDRISLWSWARPLEKRLDKLGNSEGLGRATPH
jgi:DNA-binding winged helix-turn-helix (wHTH) protein